MNWPLILTIVVGIIILFSVVLYFFQQRFIFHPEKLPEDFVFQYENQEVDEYNMQLKPGVVINDSHFKVEKPKGVVFYLKGNSKNIKGWGTFAVDFTYHGWDVIMMDYRDFGKNTGQRTQQAMKDDVQAVYDRIKSNVDEKYKDYFPGHNPIPMKKAVNAYVRSVMGKTNGSVIRFYE